MSTRFRIGPTTFLSTIALWERLIRGGGPVDPSPVNTVQPFITGDLFVGETLTCNPGIWYGAPYPTFTYQWQMWNGTAWADIVGATDQTYVPAEDNDFRCLVTGTNVHNAVTAESDAVDIEPALEAPAFSTSPTISGNSTTGSTLTGDPGTWVGNPAPTEALQWQFYDTGTSTWGDLVGETSLTVVASVDGAYRLQVTLTNTEGTAVAVSAEIVVGTIVAPSNLAIPQISGNAYVGSTLYAIPGTWSDVDSFGYQWQYEDPSTLVWTDLVGATLATYDAEVARRYRCVVSGNNEASTVTAISNILSVSELPEGASTVTHYTTSFASDDGWTLPTGVTISGGNLNFDNTTANVTASRSTPESLPAGTYTVEYSILNGDLGDTKGNVTVHLNSLADSTGEVTRTDVTGTFTDTITAASAVNTIGIRVTRQDSTMDVKVGHITLTGPGTGTILQAPSLDYSVQIRGVLETGETLYATHGVWFANPETTYAIQWYMYNLGTTAWEPVSGATSFEFVPTEPGEYRATVSVSNSEGSNSSTSASVVVTGESSGGGEEPVPTGQYTQFRIAVEQTWGAPSVSLATVQFRATVGGPAIAATSYIASSESQPAANAFDGNSSTWWTTTLGDADKYIGITCAPSAIAEIVMTYPNIEAEYYEEAPRAFRFEGWNGTSWVTFQDYEGVSVWAPGETRTYTL